MLINFNCQRLEPDEGDIPARVSDSLDCRGLPLLLAANTFSVAQLATVLTLGNVLVVLWLIPLVALAFVLAVRVVFLFHDPDGPVSRRNRLAARLCALAARLRALARR